MSTFRHPSLTRRVLQGAIVCMMLGSAVACLDSSAPAVKRIPQSDILSGMRINHDAITMAVGDTLRLTADPLNLLGDVMSVDSVPITWSSTNSALVSVDSMGLVHALAASSQRVKIIASWTHGEVERADTAQVAVTSTTHAIGSIRITPLDSLHGGFTTQLFTMPFITVQAVSPDNVPVSDNNLYINVYSDLISGHGIGVVYFPFGPMYGVFNLGYVGTFWIRATSTLYGQTYSDSLKFTALWPADATIEIAQDATTGQVYGQQAGENTIIQPCGRIAFANSTNQQITVVFDGSTVGQTCGGSLPDSGAVALGAGQTVTRVFSMAGSVTWHGQSTTTHTDIPGLSGTITTQSQ